MSTNFLSSLNFEMTLTRLPETSFMLQGTALPGITATPVLRANPFVTIPMPGDHVDFGPLNITFLVDENMENYLEIYKWMVALYFPDSHDQYKVLSNAKPGSHGLLSDLTLTTLSVGKHPLKKITYFDAFPTSMSELNFNYTESDTTYITCTTEFYFRKFEFNS